ncbi:hypothetical protein [Paenibacillus tyrfis]|uniref:hypothetical protein n=1 Tax=Paenibacillus tyrfis TaxID=1501230 RepID=UPI00068D86BB|nr:hypothetical protein [Paenibacillus tyrfis]
MEKQMLRYVGRMVEIIYLGNDGSMTQRRIAVRSVERGRIKAFCFQRQAPWVFKLENILAVQHFVVAMSIRKQMQQKPENKKSTRPIKTSATPKY